MRILISLSLLVAVACVAVSGGGGKNPWGHAMHKFFKGAFDKKPHGGKHNFNFGHSGSFSYSHSSSFSYSHSMSMSMSFSARGKRHCLKGCSHWQKDHCECNSGFKGVGDLCCYNPKEYNNTCVVRCDPYVTSSVGQSAQVFNPCGQTLTVIAAKTKSGKQSCKITVRSSDVIEKGIFATSQVQVSYEISSHEQEVVTLNGHGYSHSQGPFNPSSKEQFLRLKKRQSKSLTIRGEEIVVSRDAFRKIWTIKGCGTVINFRRNSNGGKPGVCISSEFPNAGQGQDKDSVCNLIPGNWLHGYHSKAAFYLAKSFEMREHKRMSLHCYSKTCESVTKIFNGCGPNQKKAMKMCSPILEAKFRGCAFMYHKLDGSKLFKLYTDCMAAFCAGNKFWCKQQRKQKLFIDCPIHQMNCCLFKKFIPEAVPY